MSGAESPDFLLILANTATTFTARYREMATQHLSFEEANRAIGDMISVRDASVLAKSTAAMNIMVAKEVAYQDFLKNVQSVQRMVF